MISIINDDNLSFLKNEENEKYSLIYIDPPFNTGKKQERKGLSYSDNFTLFSSFMYPRIQEAFRVLKENGSIFIHLDFREVHYIKVFVMDEIFGHQNFRNEIIWAYDYGGRSKKYWPRKHDNILWYSKGKDYIFNYDNMDRIPYASPGLVGEEKAKKGKTPTDCWFNTIVPTNSYEKTGYPTQKPLTILERIVKIHSREEDLVLDFFAGSGSFGEAAAKNNRNVVLVDSNPEAVSIMRKRLEPLA